MQRSASRATLYVTITVVTSGAKPSSISVSWLSLVQSSECRSILALSCRSEKASHILKPGGHYAMSDPLVYLDGRVVEYRQATVHVEDRGLQFADGIYEVVRYY